MHILMATFALLVGLSPPATEDEIYLQAYLNCSRYVDLTEEQLKVVEDLLQVENEFFKDHPEFPKNLRGILVAAACRESRFNPEARGDWRTINGRRVAKAHGIVQMWPWWEKAYNIYRDDHEIAGRAWLNHIVRQYKKNKRWKRCPAFFSEERQWVAAWVQTARGGTVNRANRYRCFEIPNHYKTLKRWRKNIEKLRLDPDMPGC